MRAVGLDVVDASKAGAVSLAQPSGSHCPRRQPDALAVHAKALSGQGWRAVGRPSGHRRTLIGQHKTLR